MDFLNYWDTRIDANERFFNNYPHIANFAFSECQELWDRMSVDYASLLARHTALVEAVHKAMERTADCDKKQTDDQLIADVAYLKRLASDHFKTSVGCGNRAFAAEQKYDALVGAVAWERECRAANTSRGVMHARPWGIGEFVITEAAARSEVDRLVANESAADCKGEG